MTNESKSDLIPFDAVDYLDTPEVIAAYLEEAAALARKNTDPLAVISAVSDALDALRRLSK